MSDYYSCLNKLHNLESLPIYDKLPKTVYSSKYLFILEMISAFSDNK